MRGLLALLLALFTTSALAGTATLTWTEVTSRVDGTPVTINTYRVYRHTQPTGFTTYITVTDGLSYTFTDLPAGTHYFAASAVDDAGLESALTAAVSKTIEQDAPPEVPTGLTVQPEALAVYTLVQTADRLVLVPVGTAPAGTPCESTSVRDANGIVGYLVPRGVVQWAGSVRPQVVVAQCAN